MATRNLNPLFSAGLALACGLMVVGCASLFRDPDAYQTRVRAPETPVAVSGQALAQKKQRMRRVYSDMVHVYDTAVSLRRHRDAPGLEQLERFTFPYMENQLDPLLGDRDDPRHPEFLPLEANLLFVKAEVLIELRKPSAVSKVIREIERRFADTLSVSVDYPIGDKSSVAQGLQDLVRRRKKI